MVTASATPISNYSSSDQAGCAEEIVGVWGGTRSYKINGDRSIFPTDCCALPLLVQQYSSSIIM